MPGNSLVIVEDQTLVRDLLRDALGAVQGLSVVACAGGVADGLAACKRLKPDLAIIDWSLADGTGLELVRQLKTNVVGTKILILSANEQGGIVRDAATAGIQGFVSKRHSMSVLIEAVRVILSGKIFYCPSSSRMLLNAMHGDEHDIQPPHLTPREWEVLRAIAKGMGTKDMAQSLQLSPKTVANHITAVKEKLGIHEPAGLVLYAVKHGLVVLPGKD